LVRDAVIATQLARERIPAGARIAAVLHVQRLHARERDELLDLARRHVARAERADLAAGSERFHRAPRFVIVLAEAFALRWTVEHDAVEVVGAQVLERRRE